LGVVRVSRGRPECLGATSGIELGIGEVLPNAPLGLICPLIRNVVAGPRLRESACLTASPGTSRSRIARNYSFSFFCFSLLCSFFFLFYRISSTEATLEAPPLIQRSGLAPITSVDPQLATAPRRGMQGCLLYARELRDAKLVFSIEICVRSDSVVLRV